MSWILVEWVHPSGEPGAERVSEYNTEDEARAAGRRSENEGRCKWYDVHHS